MFASVETPLLAGAGTKPSSGGYQPQLDGLRAVAILSVVFHHVGFHFPGWLDWGPIGVRMFFLLSGYLITLSLWRMQALAEDGQTNYWIALSSFHVRRLVRLVPALYLMLALGCLLGIQEFQEGLVWHAGFLTNVYTVFEGSWPGALSHLWSLSVQEQFYLIWPFVLLLLPRPFVPFALAAFILGAFAFRFGCIATGISDYFRWLMLPGVLDSFATGAFVAYWQSGTHGRPMMDARMKFRAGVLCFAGYLIARAMRYVPDSVPMIAIIDSLENLFLAWILMGTIQGWRGWVGWLLETRVLVQIGKVSYGIYIFHVLIHVAMGMWLDRAGLTVHQHAFLRSVAVALPSIGIALLSWRYLEMPLASLVRKRSESLAGASAMRGPS